MGGLTPTLGLGMGNAMSMPHTKYVTAFSLPMSNMHSGMTPQTPVSKLNILLVLAKWTSFVVIN